MKLLRQPELLPADPRPSQITVVGNNLNETLADLRKQGASVGGVETVTGCNGVYLLRVYWPHLHTGQRR